ncbi:uncharacterized protein LOC131143740 [Malania oleifera]|uniref:uncharacterized protein LOC131143740 n=1 Tax=Malania oleifera TaxID=397392 RepID=UPI0025ADBCF4|nr:uncharacterized protein LOC131143740 [Malania oleifera]XP_057948004.1 uncharacterized protein LOC131143740 [Malania oleifera]
MATPLPTAPLDLRGVLSESKRIINAHSRHFLALSVLFLLPVSFTVTVFSTLHQTLSYPDQILLQSSPREYLPTRKILQIAIVYLLFALFSLCALASITFSVFHGFYGRPVKLASAVKSLSKSFIPLFVTSVFANLAVLGIGFVIGLLAFLVLGGIRFLGFQISYDSPYFIGLCVICSMVLLLAAVYLQVNWALAGVVVVVESSWGIDSLRRSTNLVKGMRGLSLSLVVFFGFFIGILVWISSSSSFGLDGTSNGWRSLAFVVQIVVTSALISLLMLHNLAANTVFYMCCKAMQGELALEIAEEFAREYISLPFDDEKIPHLVSIIQA